MKSITERLDRSDETVSENNLPLNAENGSINESYHHRLGSRIGRRFFMKSLALGGASLVPFGAALADEDGGGTRLGSITDADAAILRFLAAAEILETDLWQQYTDFVDTDSPYTAALEVIDDNMATYIDQNTADEFSHQNFLNAFLIKMRKQPVNLEPFRTLPSSPVSPSQKR